jgi:hypothetical protein
VDISIPTLRYFARMARAQSTGALAGIGLATVLAVVGLLLISRRRRVKRAAGFTG